jgi:hypothetical protein
MSLFQTNNGQSACSNGSGGGGGGGEENNDPGYTSSIIIIDNGNDPPTGWDGTVTVTNLDEIPNTGGNGVTSVSGNGPGGVSSVTVSSIGESVGMVVFLANQSQASVTVNQASSTSLSGSAYNGGNPSSVAVSSVNGVVGLVVYNANESAGGGSTTNNNYTTTSIDLSSANNVKIGAQASTSALNVHQTNNPTTIGVSGVVGVSGGSITVTNPQVNVGVSSFTPKVGVSGYDTADVKITLDGEQVTIAGSITVLNPVTSTTVSNQLSVSSAPIISAIIVSGLNAGGFPVIVSSLNPASNVTLSGTIGVSGYNSADVKITLDGEQISLADGGEVAVTNFPSTIGVSGVIGVSGGSITVSNFPVTHGVSGIVGVSGGSITVTNPQVNVGVSSFNTIISAILVSGLNNGSFPVIVSSINPASNTTVTGTIAVSGVVGVSGGSITITNPQTTVGVSSITTTIPVSGIVGVSGGSITQTNNPTSIAISGSDGLGSYDAQVSSLVGLKGLVVHVGNQISPATSLSISNFPSTLGVSGIVGVSGGSITVTNPQVNVGVSSFSTIISAILVSGLNNGSFPVIVSSINPPNAATIAGTIAVSGVVGVSGGSITVTNPQTTVGVSSFTPLVSAVIVSGLNTGSPVSISGTVTASVSNFPASTIVSNIQAGTLTALPQIGVSSHPTSGVIVRTTSATGGVAVSSTSALLSVSFSATAAADIPFVNRTLVAAPGVGKQIVVYGINGYIVGSAATVQVTWVLTKGNQTSANIIHACGAYGLLGFENIAWQSFHGVGVGDNTILAYSITESTTNGIVVGSVHYRIENT